MRIDSAGAAITLGLALLAALLLGGGAVSFYTSYASGGGVPGAAVAALALSLVVLSAARRARRETSLEVAGNAIELRASGAEAPESFRCRADEVLDVVVESTTASGAGGTMSFRRIVLVSTRGKHPLELALPMAACEARARVAAIKTFLALPDERDDEGEESAERARATRA